MTSCLWLMNYYYINLSSTLSLKLCFLFWLLQGWEDYFLNFPEIKRKFSIFEKKFFFINVHLFYQDDSNTWSVLFEDDHLLKCGELRLHNTLLTQTEVPQEKKWLDHILISNRWRSFITDFRPDWTPSVQNNVSGKRSDHTLLDYAWKWWMCLIKTESVPDFSVLQVTL